jgi:hypothetical protein
VVVIVFVTLGEYAVFERVLLDDDDMNPVSVLVSTDMVL